MGLDLLIRNGTVVDGSGAARYRADVGIVDGRIAEIGRIRSAAERTIDAEGLIVAPGFIDGHTHMDAQVAWDRIGSCSCWHGVTSVIMGNCGFALAPCPPEEREWYARCLTAVEDIPTEAMLAGIDWTWETFPEYLATVDRLPKAINYGAYIGHYTNLFAMKDVGWADPTVAQLSAERGAHPVEVMIDLVLDNDDQMFVQPLVNEQPDHVLGMLRHPRTLATFSDSGAHVCQEMGSSLQTHMLSYWVRQKQAFTLEEAVRKLTFDNASAWELNDRGLLRTGYRADIVVFDEARVKPAMPRVETDLPGGARRLVQKAERIAATIVNGQVTLENGVATGNVPGQLLRGPGARGA